VVRSSGAGTAGHLDVVFGEVSSAGHPFPTTRILEGHATQKIIEVAADIDADMIVMGRRELGGLQTLLLDSTSHMVAQTAPRSSP
jgi:nucleotide-binding universal stress UspA family protein